MNRVVQACLGLWLASLACASQAVPASNDSPRPAEAAAPALAKSDAASASPAARVNAKNPPNGGALKHPSKDAKVKAAPTSKDRQAAKDTPSKDPAARVKPTHALKPSATAHKSTVQANRATPVGPPSSSALPSAATAPGTVNPSPPSLASTALGVAAVSAATSSTPGQEAADDVDTQVADKGLLGKLSRVGQQVTQTVSHSALKVGSKASDLVVSAMGALGVPYRRGGSTFEGFDCSGFVRTMVEQTAGLVLPRKAEQQAAATQKIEKKDLQPGDLVFFNTMRRAFSHVGIYLGDGKFIHSPKPGSEVRVEDMGQPYWSRRFDGARRVQDGAE